MPSPEMPEPRGMSIPDLIWLSVGVAVALAPGWYHLSMPPETFRGVPAPRWFSALNLLLEATQKACLALGPVVIARKARSGGALDPVEFLALSLGLSHLRARLSMMDWVGMIQRSTDAGGRLLVIPEISDLWDWSIVGLGLVALILACLRRHRPPAWLTGVMLLVAWAGFHDAGYSMIQDFANQHYPFRSDRPSLARVLYLIQVAIPIRGLAYLPLGAALLGLKGKTWAGASWTLRADLVLALTLEALVQVRYFAMDELRVKSGSFADDHQYSFVEFASIALGTLLAASLRPAWRRVFAIRAPAGTPPMEGAPAGGAPITG